MRILFTIPHYYDRSGVGYGSVTSDVKRRLGALSTVISDLRATFGRGKALIARPLRPCNARHAADIQVVVCTTGGKHVVDKLDLPAGMFEHRATDAEPMFLGYECHAVLQQNLGRFDYYCYLEDDLSIVDPLFFNKLEWFNGLAGDEAVLQPNRFEISSRDLVNKLYIDIGLAKREWSERWQDASDCTLLEAEALGVPLKFRRVSNPHSGCFFLNARQLARWAAEPSFLQRESAFVGPLESAATLGVMRLFRIYKPARDNAAFLELRHIDNRYLGVQLKVRPQ